MVQEETDNKFNFLDITIIKPERGMEISTYRKHTTADYITPNNSC
jgi:hypothetical protein